MNELDLPPQELIDEFSALLKRFNDAGFVLSAKIGFSRPADVEHERNSNFKGTLSKLPSDIQADSLK